MPSIRTRNALLAGAAAGLLFTQGAMAQSTDPKAEALIAAAKSASGGPAWDKITNGHEKGKITAGGLTGTYEIFTDLEHLRQGLSYAMGPASGGQGWDGKAAWSTDSSKQVRVEASGEAVAGAIQQSYMSSYTVFFPDRWPAEKTYAGARTADGVAYEAIKVTPKGAEPFEIWFDPSTHLIAREVQLTGSMPQTQMLSQYTEDGGVKLPFHIVQRTGGDPKFDQIADTVTIDLNTAIPASRYAPPPPPTYDATFPPGRSAVTVPFRLLNNHIYVQASIDSRPPVSFIYDTGATNFMDKSHATPLGVKSEGALPGGGFGDNIDPVGLAKAESVSIGGLTLHDQVFATDDSTGFDLVEGENLTGLLGYEFVKRAVLTIDYAGQTMTFTRPDAFTPPKGVTPIPFTFNSHIPMVEATVDGIPGQFEIDTGARSALTLMHPFAEANHLVEKYHATHIATTGYGVGGPSRALMARVGNLVIGPVSIAKPVTDMVLDKHGAAAAARTAGNIGGDILKRFTVTLDYGHQLMWLQPNAMASEPDVFDRSGLWVSRAADGGTVVADVSTDSAGSAAGFSTGDRLLAVDGKPVAGMELAALRELFKQAPGTKLTLAVHSQGKGTRKVELVLADQV